MISPNLYSRLARYYDLTHGWREYAREARFIRELFNRFNGSATVRALDLFCGTGGHSIALARLGFDVVGLDASEDMLMLAKRKANSGDMNVRFETGDCRSLAFVGEFDLVLGLGQSLQYLVTYDEINSAFRSVRCALRSGGLWIFDIIDGWQMIQPFESKRCDFGEDGARVLKRARTELDRSRRIATCRATWIISTPDSGVDVDETVEEYRILFTDEVRFLLEMSGFEVVGVYGDCVADAPVDDNCVALTFVARAMAADVRRQ
jgi:SAM-dependent methyltransferase